MAAGYLIFISNITGKVPSAWMELLMAQLALCTVRQKIQAEQWEPECRAEEFCFTGPAEFNFKFNFKFLKI